MLQVVIFIGREVQLQVFGGLVSFFASPPVEDADADSDQNHLEYS